MTTANLDGLLAAARAELTQAIADREAAQLSLGRADLHVTRCRDDLAAIERTRSYAARMTTAEPETAATNTVTAVTLPTSIFVGAFRPVEQADVSDDMDANLAAARAMWEGDDK